MEPEFKDELQFREKNYLTGEAEFVLLTLSQENLRRVAKKPAGRLFVKE